MLEQCALESGYITPGRSEASTTTTASAAKKGVASTSSSSAATKPKRTIEKGGELHRRHSDGEVQHAARKGLNDEFDRVTNIDAALDGDAEEPELVADVPPPQLRTDDVAPPQWWNGAWQAIEHKMDSRAGSLADRRARMFDVTN